MITGRKIANGSHGRGEAPVTKTPLIAALQATANQRVSGIITASQVVRRWFGVRSVLSRPSHKPTAISPWVINWCAAVGTPLAGMNGCQVINAIHSIVSGTSQSRMRQAGYD